LRNTTRIPNNAAVQSKLISINTVPSPIKSKLLPSNIMLAPMEGVVDSEMRAVLTAIGGYDRCVTEFVRVNRQRLPDKVFLRFAPELESGGTTPSGTPVYLQLLGSDPNSMAINAANAQRLEPHGIDLNFGCPSKTVNKSDGGSALLREPNRVGDIVRAVRDAVDPKIPITAKIRLGFSNHDLLDEVVDNIIEAGADELCIHARTREDRYKPPAYWSAVHKVSQRTPIPVTINGEIWSISDAHKAMLESGCSNIMLGRGALACPDLAKQIKATQQMSTYQCMTWPDALAMMVSYLKKSKNKHPLFVSNRAKQWLVFLQMHYKESATLFHQIKRLKEAEQTFAAIQAHLDADCLDAALR